MQLSFISATLLLATAAVASTKSPRAADITDLDNLDNLDISPENRDFLAEVGDLSPEDAEAFATALHFLAGDDDEADDEASSGPTRRGVERRWGATFNFFVRLGKKLQGKSRAVDINPAPC